MTHRVLFVLACSVLSCASVRAGAASVSGTWVYVEKWEATRADVVPGQYTSHAIVLRFCPDGLFTMLKCMLYRQRHESTTIGADDGLEIYRGSWSSTAEGATVTYHLADAEITFTGYEAARQQQNTASATLARDDLHMPVVRLFPPPAKEFSTTFQRKEKLPAPLKEKFVDCTE
jgi:hypothetical protein